jgi:hypothetical protein
VVWCSDLAVIGGGEVRVRVGVSPTGEKMGVGENFMVQPTP